MKLYLNLKDLPECRDIAFKQRLVAWFCCFHKTLFHWPVVLLFVSGIASCLLGVYIIMIYESFTIGSLVLLLSLVLITAFKHVQYCYVRPYLRDYFATTNRT